MSTANLSPLLRFSKFNKLWKLEELGKFYTFKNGINADKEQYGKGSKFINVLDVLQPYPITGSSIKGRVEIDAKTLEKNSVAKGNLLFQRSSETREEVGTSNVYLGNETVTFGGFVIRGKPLKQVNPVYMNYLLKSAKARKEITTKSGGSTRYNVGQGTLSAVKIFVVDSDNEQQKIADFLTSVDTKISQLTEKHHLLKEYKKGVMQQVFSQQIRFKDEDGKEFPEWGNKRLGDLTSKVGSGSTPKGGSDVYVESGITFIRSQNVYGNILDLTDAAFITEDTHQKMKGSQVKPLDVLLNITGASIGRSCVVPEQFTEANVNQHVCIIRPKKDLDPHFLQLFLSGYGGQKSIFQSQAGGGREGLNFVAIRAFKCPFPHLQEQQKIAHFLQSIDRKIEAVAVQVEQTKLFKKGLLQQMFV